LSDRNPSPEVQKRLYYLVGSFFGIVTLYVILFKLELVLLIDLLYIATSALFVAYFYLSHGFAKTLPTKDELNPAWSEEKRIRYAERIRVNKERSKALIYPLIPLMAVMAFDMVWRAFFAQ
jgi:hypothetical protein